MHKHVQAFHADKSYRLYQLFPNFVISRLPKFAYFPKTCGKLYLQKSETYKNLYREMNHFKIFFHMT